jgi:hypothetical protein
MLRLASIAELERYPFPDLTPPARHAHLEGRIRHLHERGLFVIGFMEWTIFEIAWHRRGMAELCGHPLGARGASRPPRLLPQRRQLP